MRKITKRRNGETEKLGKRIESEKEGNGKGRKSIASPVHFLFFTDSPIHLFSHSKILLLTLALTLFLANGKESIAAESVKVAIVPWKINAEEKFGYLKGGVYDMFASRIGAEPTIEIVKESFIKSALSKYGQEEMTEDIAKNIGNEVNADYVIYGSITLIADSVSIDAKTAVLKKVVSPIFFVSQSKGLDNLVSMIDEMAKHTKAKILNAEKTTTAPAAPPASSEYTGKFISKEKPAETMANDDFIIKEKSNTKHIWKSPQFSTVIKYIEIADVDGDKKNEVIVLDSHNLFIYRLNGQALEIVKEFKGNVAHKNYSVSIADMNNNGVPEIYISRITNDRLDSYAMEYKDGEFQTIASGFKWFIKTVGEKAAPMLIGQKYDETTGFFGAVQRLEWKDGKLQAVKAVDIPKGLNLYNFEIVDLNRNGTADIIAMDEKDYLRIYNKDKQGLWQEIWKSGEFYGGSLNRLELGTSSGSNEGSDFVDIKARIVYTDLYGNGFGEIIISRNDPGAIGRYFKRARSYDKSEIINLTWQGSSLEESWRTKKIDGYIADYIVKDIDSDGSKELVIAVVTDGGIGKSYIMVYKMKGR
ncbi:MAG: VCBS repeat-containing protein [Deltaproteobacteria bacterium]|nr:VCBS repeat-containing protein [Deltaproteobacteria bacterium]